MTSAALLLLLVLGPSGYFAWWKHRAATRARGWIAAGQAIGLRYEQRVVRILDQAVVSEVLCGKRGGARVEVWASVTDAERSIHAKALFERPTLLGMLASTHRSHPLFRMAGPAIQGDVPPGWTVHAHDAARVEALLPRLRRALQRYPGNGHDVILDDAAVTVFAPAAGRRDEIEALLDEAITLRARVVAGIGRIGAGAWQERVAAEWSRFATREHFALDAGAVRLTGRADRFDVSVQLEPGGALQTVLSFTLRAPARGRATLGRAGSGGLLLSLFGQAATPTGDAAFDARFQASSATPGEAAAALDDGVRAALLELPDAIWGGEIAGAQLTLRADDVLPGEALEETLACVDRLAVRLARPQPGGYRDPVTAPRP